MASKPKAIPAVKPVSAAVSAAVAPAVVAAVSAAVAPAVVAPEPVIVPVGTVHASIVAANAAADILVPAWAKLAIALQDASDEGARVTAATLAQLLALRAEWSGADYLRAQSHLLGTGGSAKAATYNTGIMYAPITALFTTRAKKDLANDAKAAKAAGKEWTAEEAAEFARLRTVKMRSRISTRMNEQRTVGQWLADPVHYQTATTAVDGKLPAFTALLKAANLKPAAPEAAPEAAPAAPAAPTAPTAPSVPTATTCEQFVSTFGVLAVLEACAAILAVEPSTALYSKTLSGIRDKVKEARTA
jgi:hypothetical protein